jgi:hypothetical protein
MMLKSHPMIPVPMAAMKMATGAVSRNKYRSIMDSRILQTGICSTFDLLATRDSGFGREKTRWSGIRDTYEMSKVDWSGHNGG